MKGLQPGKAKMRIISKYIKRERKKALRKKERKKVGRWKSDIVDRDRKKGLESMYVCTYVKNVWKGKGKKIEEIQLWHSLEQIMWKYTTQCREKYLTWRFKCLLFFKEGEKRTLKWCRETYKQRFTSSLDDGSVESIVHIRLFCSRANYYQLNSTASRNTSFCLFISC
jgi:hypothetical protein